METYFVLQVSGNFFKVFLITLLSGSVLVNVNSQRIPNRFSIKKK